MEFTGLPQWYMIHILMVNLMHVNVLLKSQCHFSVHEFSCVHWLMVNDSVMYFGWLTHHSVIALDLLSDSTASNKGVSYESSPCTLWYSLMCCSLVFLLRSTSVNCFDFWKEFRKCYFWGVQFCFTLFANDCLIAWSNDVSASPWAVCVKLDNL